MKTKHVEGSGLFRLIGEKLTKAEAEILKKEIKAQKHGVSTHWQMIENTDDDTGIIIKDAYQVWQRIASDAHMQDEMRESMQPYAEYEQLRALKSQFNDRYHDLNFKVNVLLGAASAAILAGIGAFLINVRGLSPAECMATLAVITVVVLTGLWLNCEAKRCSRR